MVRRIEGSSASLEYGGVLSSRVMRVVIIVRRHRPRKRAIPYAAAYRMIIGVSGILGRQVKPGDDSCDYCSPSSPAKADDPVRRGLSNDHRRLWNTGSPGQPGR